MAGVLEVLEGIKVRLMVGLTWRLSRSRLLASLRHFAATEADSAWQLHYVAQRVADPAQKADLFGQILEEMHHAAEFERLYRAHAERPLVPARYERKALYPRAADVGRFFVYCHVGEAAAAARFKHIHDSLRPGPIRDVLRRILRDEAQHVHGAAELIAESGIPAARVRREVAGIKLRRRWEAWLRAGRNIADVVATATLSVAYFAVGPFGWLAARRRVFARPSRASGDSPRLDAAPAALEVAR